MENIETITDSILKSLIDDIMSMKPANLIRCINNYARWTNYSKDEVCKIKNEHVISIIDPEYLGIHSSRLYININDFKKICIQMIIRDWTWANNEEKELMLKTFSK